MVKHHPMHLVELTEVDPSEGHMLVAGKEGQLIGEFFLAKAQEVALEDVAQAAYEDAYGKVGE